MQAAESSHFSPRLLRAHSKIKQSPQSDSLSSLANQSPVLDSPRRRHFKNLLSRSYGTSDSETDSPRQESPRIRRRDILLGRSPSSPGSTSPSVKSSTPQPNQSPQPDALSGLSKAASSAHLENATAATPFDKILNFRDLSDGCPERFNSGKIYRCGLVHMATEQDFKVLTETYGIKTTIDLRSSDEIRQSPCPLYEQYFPTDRSRLGRTRCRVQCPLWRVTMNFKMLLDAKKYSTFGSMAFSFATLQIDTGIKHLVSEMNEVKLLGMYKCFLRYFQPQIREALEVLSDPNNYPIMFHCSLGKDRTGTMASLVSSIIGMDRATIIQEYAKSEKNLAPVKDEIVKKLAQFHLESWLADSPPEAMEELFKFIDETWGDLDSFFREIGFSGESQARLYNIMNKKNTQ